MSPYDASHPWVTIATNATGATTNLTLLYNFNVASDSTLRFEKPSKKELRRRQLLAWTREAIQEAREALRTSDADPSGVLPRQPRREPSKRLHLSPRFRRRICAGSSRYRVLRP